MLLVQAVLPRRMDAASAVGSGLEIAARGMGHRSIAAALGLAEGTVRGWIRRFAVRAEDVRRHFTVTLVALADEPVVPEASVSPVADAVVAAHQAAAVKWAGVNTVSRWEFASRAIAGGLLAWPSSQS
ncbi:helix-turn-helix domain-containing protein [Streptomyces sp. MBT27]|uniref:helix-turn-helix domain-containing protein n=1 Tax=Streptomyces sp. MBT27 TaxID=1488356 RepID=UPI001877EE9A|nr:helix-turn-helix domain-containing protein [Streptomyces sp. MBT27]